MHKKVVTIIFKASRACLHIKRLARTSFAYRTITRVADTETLLGPAPLANPVALEDLAPLQLLPPLHRQTQVCLVLVKRELVLEAAGEHFPRGITLVQDFSGSSRSHNHSSNRQVYLGRKGLQIRHHLGATSRIPQVECLARGQHLPPLVSSLQTLEAMLLVDLRLERTKISHFLVEEMRSGPLARLPVSQQQEDCSALAVMRSVPINRLNKANRVVCLGAAMPTISQPLLVRHRISRAPSLVVLVVGAASLAKITSNKTSRNSNRLLDLVAKISRQITSRSRFSAWERALSSRSSNSSRSRARRQIRARDFLVKLTTISPNQPLALAHLPPRRHQVEAYLGVAIPQIQAVFLALTKRNNRHLPPVVQLVAPPQVRVEVCLVVAKDLEAAVVAEAFSPTSRLQQADLVG